MPLIPRARGMLLRLVRRRGTSIAIGLVLVGVAAWLRQSGGFDAWWVDGTALVVGATGVALIWAGITGPRGDWSN
jgi:hypothetical protein